MGVSVYGAVGAAEVVGRVGDAVGTVAGAGTTMEVAARPAAGRGVVVLGQADILVEVAGVGPAAVEEGRRPPARSSRGFQRFPSYDELGKFEV